MKRLLVWLAGGLIFLMLAIPTSVYIASGLWMDDTYPHTKATEQLPAFSSEDSAARAPTLSIVSAGEFKFRARSAGFGGQQGNVILLHGFPESSVMYEKMIPELAGAGYQVVAFDQRGYSPGARPSDLDAYTTDHLMQDVLDVADSVGFERFHLVGHDWGAVVGWLLVMAQNPRITSWSALSIPHMGAYAEAMTNDPDQQSRSAYVGFFQTPWLPEAVFSFNNFAMMKEALYGEHQPNTKAEYLTLFSEPGALTSALNWYRASGLTNVDSSSSANISIPTAYIWGNKDGVVGEAALAAQQGYFDGNLSITELNTGHWLTETEGDAVNNAVLSHILENSR